MRWIVLPTFEWLSQHFSPVCEASSNSAPPGQKGPCVTCKTAYTKDVFYDEMGWGYATKTFDELAAKIPADG